MHNDERTMSWRIIESSVRGASKAARDRAGMRLRNQDAVDWWPESREGRCVVLAVADGHGGVPGERSHIGAKFAAHTAVELLAEYIEKVSGVGSDGITMLKAALALHIPQTIVRRWQQKVEGHLEQQPFKLEEWDRVGGNSGSSSQRSMENRYLAYGTTLLAVAVTESLVAYLQIGDGDIVVVSEAGEASRPLPRDERHFGNATTSLAMQPEASVSTGRASDVAWGDFRTRVQPVHLAAYASPPALILVSTDGYANSFQDDAAFLQAGPDILQTIQTEGVHAVEENIEHWLTETSEQGSRDDITVGLVIRVGS